MLDSAVIQLPKFLIKKIPAAGKAGPQQVFFITSIFMPPPTTMLLMGFHPFLFKGPVTARLDVYLPIVH